MFSDCGMCGFVSQIKTVCLSECVVATRSTNFRMRGADLKFNSVATCGLVTSFFSGVKFHVATSDHIHSKRC